MRLSAQRTVSLKTISLCRLTNQAAHSRISYYAQTESEEILVVLLEVHCIDKRHHSDGS
jgi:hypothetical protein